MSVVTRYFEGEAGRSYRLVHVEAWRQNKLRKRKYCGEHRQSAIPFDR